MQFGLIPFVASFGDTTHISEALNPWLKDIEKELGEPLPIIADHEADTVDLPIIFVQSGGTEGTFKEAFEKLSEPYVLLAGHHFNALAASLEILTFLQQQGKKAEVVHGSPQYVRQRLKEIQNMENAKKKLQQTRLGVIGPPSDWLIASHVDAKQLKDQLGPELVEISIEEFQREIDAGHRPSKPSVEELMEKTELDQKTMEEALDIYGALKVLVKRYALQGLTIRCFDLLASHKNTSCLGVSLLNDEGIIAGCEGDVPTLVSMVLLQYLTQQPTFMANPSEIDIHENQVIFAHCTIPTTMVQDYTLPSHFESRLGVAVQGQLPLGPGTLFKISPDMQTYFISRMEMKENLYRSNLCRTQIVTTLEEDVQYFLQEPLGNHHVLIQGEHVQRVNDFFSWLE